MGLPRGAGLVNVQIKDKVTLYASYLPFIKGGALFVPSQRPFKLGEDVFVAITLPDDPERFPLNGKIVWVNHRTQGQRLAGFAIQLTGELGERVRRKVEAQLGGMLQSDKPTYTL